MGRETGRYPPLYQAELRAHRLNHILVLILVISVSSVVFKGVFINHEIVFKIGGFIK